MKKLLTIFAVLLLIAGVLFAQNKPVTKPVTPDEKMHKAQFQFNGQWMPDFDAAEIGPNNMKTLQNLRYTDSHVVGINGYSKINSTAIATYIKIKNGHQLRTPERTTPSYVFVQAWDAGGSNSRIYYNSTTVPDAGEFYATPILTEASGFGLGRFSDAPQGRITYCNGVECNDYAGQEDFVAAFFTATTTGTLVYPVNKTKAANNSLTSAGNTIAIETTGGVAEPDVWLILSTRPIQASKYYVSTVNSTTASTNAWTYTSSGWTDLTDGGGWNDGTITGTSPSLVSLGQTGTMKFDADYASAVPYHFEGTYLYAYMFQLTAGNATLSQVTTHPPWQDLVDVWDGVYRQPIEFQYQDDATWEDYTLEVNYETGAEYVDEIGADISSLVAADDEIVIFFEERMAAIRWEMISTKTNSNAATVIINYWDGDSFATAGTVTDETLVGGNSLGQTGLMSWNPPAETAEHPYRDFGTTGYAYQIKFSGNLSATIVVDIITGIPAQGTVPPYKFPSMYRDRRLLAGYTAGNEGNRVDFSMTNAPDVFNGLDSSMDGIQSLYFGGNEPLTAGAELFNRYGSRIFTLWVAYKDNAIYVLKGSDPEDFEVETISTTVGCPAPLTLAKIAGYQVSEDLVRNIHIFLSYSGPKAFDGTNIYDIPGIDNYFNPSHPNFITFSNIENARGWVDPSYEEYNLVLPGDTWVVYDLKRHKWYQKATGAAEMPQAGWTVMDTDGAQYVYGGIDTGFMLRLENGTSWAGTAITQKLITGDFWPSQSVWEKTRIRYLKVIAKRIDESHALEVDHLVDTDMLEGLDTTWADTDDTAWVDTDDTRWVSFTAPEVSLNLTAGAERVVRATSGTNLLGWSHAFKFSVSTSSTSRALELIGFGIVWQYVRDDF